MARYKLEYGTHDHLILNLHPKPLELFSLVSDGININYLLTKNVLLPYFIMLYCLETFLEYASRLVNYNRRTFCNIGYSALFLSVLRHIALTCLRKFSSKRLLKLSTTQKLLKIQCRQYSYFQATFFVNFSSITQMRICPHFSLARTNQFLSVIGFVYAINSIKRMCTSPETCNLKVVGSNPSTIYWMDIFTLICCKICAYISLKNSKIKETEARNSPFL